MAPSVRPGDGVKIVGRRSLAGSRWDDARRLQETAAALRGTARLVPRGLYRFSTFHEADEWMTKMTALTHARRGSKTSSGSAGR